MLVHNGARQGLRSLDSSTAGFDALRANALFALLPGEELRALVTGAKERTLEPGQALVEKGGPADKVWLILEGTAAADKDGRDSGLLPAGALVGAEALAGRPKRDATVRALGPLKVLELPGPFSNLAKAYPAFAAAIHARFKPSPNVEIDLPRSAFEGPSARPDHGSGSVSGPGRYSRCSAAAPSPSSLASRAGAVR